MFAIRLTAIFCLSYVVYVRSESDFCCVKHKYVQDTRGFYIKKCVLGTKCPQGNENSYIFDEEFLAAQQNYVEHLKRSRNYDETFQNYIKDNEDFVAILDNYVTRGKTTEKYNNLVNKYQQLEDEYNDYVNEKFPNDDNVEENLNIDRKRRSGEVNKQNSNNLDQDYLLARRNYQGKLKNYDDKFIENKDLQNYVTGVKTMDKYNNLLNKYKQLEAECKNHDKEALPKNDEVEENPDDIDTESEDVDDEANLVTQQNHLEKLKEYADNYQKYDEKFQNFIKNYENYVKELENYVRGVKTTEKYNNLINMHKELDNEYNNYVKENFPKNDKVEDTQDNIQYSEDSSGDNTKVNKQNKYVLNKEYLEAQQNYLKKLKAYGDKHQIHDRKFENFVKNNEDFVNDLQNFVTGAKTMEKYNSLVNRYQQIQDEYNDYVKENFPNGGKVEEDLNIRRKRRSVESEEYLLYDKVNPHATAYEKCLWKYNQYGSTICDQLQSLAYWENLAQALPIRDKEYNSVVDNMEDYRDLDDEDNNINVLFPGVGRRTKQKQRIDSLLTAAPNCFEGSGNLAHNNLCKLEFYDY